MDLWEQCPPEIEERITAASSIQILFEENMRYDRPSWSEPKAWLGTQAYKLLYIVVLVEVLCGVGRLSTTMEGALPDCSVIRIGYAYRHDMGLPLHRWYFQWPVRALCPAHVWFSWPCTRPCISSYTMHDSPCLHCLCTLSLVSVCATWFNQCVCTRCLSLDKRMAQ